jgi:stage III sporulation protein AH
MKEKKTELSEMKETEAPKKKFPEKIRELLNKFGKRNAIIAASVLMIGLAVLLNWVLFSAGSKKPDGYEGYDQPSGNVQTTPDGIQSADGNGSYFSATQVSRQRARDEAIEVLQSVIDNAETSEETRAEALAGINKIAEEIQKEADIESLIVAKGFEQCVAVLNGDTISIVVSADTLQPAQLAQINEIVYSQTGILPAGVTIIHK